MARQPESVLQIAQPRRAAWQIRNSSGSREFARPGHIFPLRARQGGVLKRAGHTEAAVDLGALGWLRTCRRDL